MKDKITRQSNFELLRIICMIFIVLHHVLYHGKALSTINVHSDSYYFISFLNSLSIVAVNCYVLISGYFGIKSNFKVRKVIQLYLQVLFYSIIITLLFLIFSDLTLSKKLLVKMLFPVMTKSWWFITIYIILYILSPYLNKLLNSFSFIEYTKLIIILTFTFVIWPSIPNFSPIDTSNGYSLYNFITLYILGGYIRLYLNNLKISKNYYFTLYLIGSFLLTYHNVSHARNINENYGIYGYNYYIIFLNSLFLFMFFKEINFSNNKINKISSLTLGVYLIHDNSLVRSILYDYLNYYQHFYKDNFFLYTFLIVLLIYITCSVIEFGRYYLFNFIPLSFYNKIDYLIDRLIVALSKCNILVNNQKND